MAAASTSSTTTPRKTPLSSHNKGPGKAGENPKDTYNQHQPSSMKSTISQSEVTSILSACSSNFRFDGRSNLHLRPYTLLKSSSSSSSSQQQQQQQLDLTPILSNGSSRLFLPGSNTNVICSIKAEIVHPPEYQTKHEGLIELNIDLLPFASTSSSSSMDRRNIRKEEMEITSTLMHLLIPHLLNKEQLVIVRGKYVWRLNIDVLVMHCDGNLMDVCSMAIWGAMQNLKLPNVVPVIPFDSSNEEEGSSASKNNVGKKTTRSGKKALDEIMLDGDIANAVVPNEVTNCPIVVTINLLPKYEESFTSNKSENNMNFTPRKITKQGDCVMVVDANKQEEACATTKVSVSIDPLGNICGVHKYGSSSIVLGGDGNNSCSVGGTIPFHVLAQVQNTAVSVSKNMFVMLMKDESFGGGDVTLDNFSNFFRGHFELQ